MHRNKSVDLHQFAMVPKSEIPRSTFKREWTHKTAFNSGYLIPAYVDEVLPGDSFSLHVTAFARLATPIVPVMDNLHMDWFFFYVPNRLVWTNWVKFMGEQDNPGDSISYTIPYVTSPVGGYAVGSIFDYMGLPTVGQVGGANTIFHSALPLRCYNAIFHEWFRDQNLQVSTKQSTGDGPDPYTGYALLRRGKRHDYFTGCLPWTQKGTAVSLPLGTTAPVKGIGWNALAANPAAINTIKESGGATRNYAFAASGTAWANNIVMETTTGAGATAYPTIYADLTAATAATINQLRQSFQIQRLLERDARGGTRYTEIVRSHFGVVSPDARLQRPEYLGGGSFPVTINPIAQTSATGVTGGSTPAGSLAAMGTALTRCGFSTSFVEHGYIIGLVNIRADLTYQQGIRKMWKRSTRYDFYFPVFAALGEQAVLNQEIYADGSANDTAVFGYQERWAEYRYFPSQITGIMRSTAASTIDYWHLAQKFTSLPTLNATFIQDTPPVSRTIAVPSQPEFICDMFFSCKTTRAMPLYSVPGLIDHF